MFKKSFIYLFIVYLMQILSIVLNILFIRNLSLENLGQITVAKVYFQFMDYMHLGSRFTMDRYIPISSGEEGKYITLVAMTISFLSSMVFIFIVYVFLNHSYIVLIFMVAGSIFAQGTIYKAYFRAVEKTKEMIWVIMITMFFPLVVQIIAILFFDFQIYLISFLISYIIGFIVLIYHFNLLKYIQYDLIIYNFKSYYKATGLLFGISLVIFLSFSIDKIMLQHYKGDEILGEYSIVLFVFATLLIIPGTLTELVFPRIIKKVTSSSKLFHIKETLFVLLPTLLAVIFANLLMNFFITKFTDYTYLLPYLHLVTWGVLPYAFTSIIYHTLNALDQRKKLLAINLILLIAYSIFIYIALQQNDNIIQTLVVGKISYGILLLLMEFGLLYQTYTKILKER